VKAVKSMKRNEAMQRMLADMRADLLDYRALRALLEEQFEAAVQHRSGQICDIGGRITSIAGALEQRRRMRAKLASRLLQGERAAPMQAIAARLQGVSRATFEACWKSLEASVQECKALNQRNCRLLMDQYDIMQRVLHTEHDTYAPE